MYNNELYHYGVKGMKWGVRRARYKAAKKEYKAAKKEYESAKKSEPIRKTIKRGAAIATAGLAVYGTYKMHELMTSPNAHWTINGKEYVGREGYDVAKSLLKQMVTRKH